MTTQEAPVDLSRYRHLIAKLAYLAKMLEVETRNLAKKVGT